MRVARCPKCGSANLIETVFDLLTNDAYERAKRGELVVGGCCAEPGTYTTFCLDCFSEFFNPSWYLRKFFELLMMEGRLASGGEEEGFIPDDEIDPDIDEEYGEDDEVAPDYDEEYGEDDEDGYAEEPDA